MSQTCDYVQLNRVNGKWHSVEYSMFSIGDEAVQYQLTVDGYSGDAADAITNPPHPNFKANGKTFSTKDIGIRRWYYLFTLGYYFCIFLRNRYLT